MHRESLVHYRRTLIAAALLMTAGSLPALAGVSEPSYLTPPSNAPAREVAAEFLASRAEHFGVTAADLAEAALTDVVPSRHNGVTHLYYRQRVNGLEVDGSEVSVHVDRRGRVFSAVGAPVAELAARAGESRSFPLLSQEDAVAAAADRLGLGPVLRLDLLDSSSGADRAARFANSEISEEPIPVRLRYYRVPGSDRLVLAWHLSIKDPRNPDWWSLWIDAETGELVGQMNWTADASYEVFASAKESPNGGGRTVEVDPDLDGGIASPFGWHDIDGIAGADFTVTRGNNVRACVDADANNSCDALSEPDGGASLLFTGGLVPLDLVNDQPASYRPAAVVNLFYWNNVMHDVLYQYGFDEVSGNFQENNYGRGGLGSDSVNADAQDGSGTNNANFSTPGDGSRPRMQMFRWTAPKAIDVHAPAPVAGPQVAGSADFGPASYTIAGRNVVLVSDGSGAVADDGCCNDGNTLCVSPNWPGITGVVPAPIALLRRGQCEFGTKAVNAQNAGASGVILINNVETIIAMGAGVNGGSATIPILSIPLTVGNTWIANATGLNVTMDSSSSVGPDRDSDLDNGVIAHEYGHGVSNRLTGGPSTLCLSGVEQQGEGWSDWMTLFLHASPGDTSTTSRTIGSYVNFDDFVPLAAGIRRYPYNTSMAINPLTYGGIADTLNTQPHGIGVIWATTLWDMYWNLIDRYGYDSDIYDGSGGNNLAFQLVIDGMKTQPCFGSLTFPNSRDAIVAADAASYEGENFCEIWRAFGKRGVGLAASTGASNNDRVVTEDFTIPAECPDLIFSDGFGMANGAPRFDGFSRWSAVVGAAP